MKNRRLKFSGLLLASIIVIASLIYAINVQPVVYGSYTNTGSDLNTFNSYTELIGFIRSNGSIGYGRYHQCEDLDGSVVFLNSRSTKSVTPSSASSGDETDTVDYSETNVQVQGVDEPDKVKTDGKYLYVISDGVVYIVKAVPSTDAEVLSKISIEGGHITDIFVNGEKIIVFSSTSRQPIYLEDIVDGEDNSLSWYKISITKIRIYDLSEITNPELFREIEIDGRFYDARMIDNFVYIVTSESTRDIICKYDDKELFNVPQVRINGLRRKLPADHIYYVDSDEQIDTMTHVASIDINLGKLNQKSFLLDSSRTLYVSKNNIFLTYTSYQYIEPDSMFGEIVGRRLEKTIIHKVSIDDLDVKYIGQGEVPGRILNQFSMDEHNGFLRIATTIGNVWDTETLSKNNIYILDENLERTGEIEGIAPGERIYSARFMGNKAYLVTFKKVDPFFTLDLSDPYNPKVLGKLKIPGYSDYLHPLDENHIIGIGKDTVEALDSQKGWRGIDFAWYQGIKIALFDVSDFENPKELAKVVIGDRGTHSPALYNHKAFLFDKEKELLVIPVSVYEIDEEIKQQNDGYTGNTRGKFTFQGAYVYKLNVEDGFELKGRITHLEEDEINSDSRFYRRSNSDIFRSLYIGDTLYTISNSMIKMNKLSDLSETNSVLLN